MTVPDFVRKTHRLWMPSEIEIAARIFRETPGTTIGKRGARAAATRKIAAAIARTIGMVESRLTAFGPTFDRPPRKRVEPKYDQTPICGSIRAPNDVLAERDRRLAAFDLRTPTQEFFGDPPPGYSALDRTRR